MAIDTLESLSGFIAANPQLSKTERGDARFYARVGHERYRRNEDGSTTKLDTTFHHLLMFGRAAERAYALFRKGDRFVAEGHIRVHDSGEEFVAQRIGHDATRTLYTVHRDGGARAHRPTLKREPGVELTPGRQRADDINRPTASSERGPFRALTAKSATAIVPGGQMASLYGRAP